MFIILVALVVVRTILVAIVVDVVIVIFEDVVRT